MSGLVFGFQCNLYRNTGAYGTPTWTVIPTVKDATLDLGGSDVDVSTRGNGGWKADALALLEAGLEFEVIWDTADTNLAALITAFFDRSVLDFLILDGAATVVGSQGLRAQCQIMKFPRDEKLDDAVRVKISIKPSYSAYPPTWYTVSE